MVFKTTLNKDILNIVFEYANISVDYLYYIRQKESLCGFRNIKLNYNCGLCDKKLRNIKQQGYYGFMLYFYKYYDVDITNYCFNKTGLTRYYHSKQSRFNPISREYELVSNKNIDFIHNHLRNVCGDVQEGIGHISITIRNMMEEKILGMLIIKTMNYISRSYIRFNKEKRHLQKCGVKMDINIDKLDNIKNSINMSILDMNDDIKLGYYCRTCANSSKIYKFIKL